MKFGYLSVNNAEGIHPGELGSELEARGFESLWVPEHSHIPVDSVKTFPDPSRPMPDAYAHMMSPFISLTAAAAATERLILGTGDPGCAQQLAPDSRPWCRLERTGAGKSPARPGVQEAILGIAGKGGSPPRGMGSRQDITLLRRPLC